MFFELSGRTLFKRLAWKSLPVNSRFLSLRGIQLTETDEEQRWKVIMNQWKFGKCQPPAVDSSLKPLNYRSRAWRSHFEWRLTDLCASLVSITEKTQHFALLTYFRDVAQSHYKLATLLNSRKGIISLASSIWKIHWRILKWVLGLTPPSFFKLKEISISNIISISKI